MPVRCQFWRSVLKSVAIAFTLIYRQKKLDLYNIINTVGVLIDLWKSDIDAATALSAILPQRFEVIFRTLLSLCVELFGCRSAIEPRS